MMSETLDFRPRSYVNNIVVSLFIISFKRQPSEKISCKGVATTVFGTKVPFEVRSWLKASSRGHIIEFPGLEIALNPSLQVFIPVLPEISVDIGNNFKLENISVDGIARTLKFSAIAKIAPTEPKLKYVQQNGSYLASFHCDAGKWLTNIGNFTK